MSPHNKNNDLARATLTSSAALPKCGVGWAPFIYHGSAPAWLTTAESWRQGWGEAGRSGSARCCAPAGMASSRRPRPRARTPWGIGAPESFVEASCAAVSPDGDEAAGCDLDGAIAGGVGDLANVSKR